MNIIVMFITMKLIGIIIAFFLPYPCPAFPEFDLFDKALISNDPIKGN